MAFGKKKKAAAKKRMAPPPRPTRAVQPPRPKPKPVVETIYYRGCDGAPPALYRVEATEVVAAKGGGLDLTEVPPGAVSLWSGGAWIASRLPPVGHEAGCVRHTKNTARVGAD